MVKHDFIMVQVAYRRLVLYPLIVLVHDLIQVFNHFLTPDIIGFLVVVQHADHGLPGLPVRPNTLQLPFFFITNRKFFDDEVFDFEKPDLAVIVLDKSSPKLDNVRFIDFLNVSTDPVDGFQAEGLWGKFAVLVELVYIVKNRFVLGMVFVVGGVVADEVGDADA
jgi:hypothetical protein